MKINMRKKFTCPKCNEQIAGRVLDTEPWYTGFKRYRRCEKCGCKFVTVEKVAYITRGYVSERKASTENNGAEA